MRLELPKNMLLTLSKIETLSNLLMDQKGTPKPLKISVKPSLLPLWEKNQPVVVLSYLQIGRNSVFGFNQQPNWQELEIEWWKQQTAAVGVKVEAVPKTGNSHRSITIPESPWSFYHLLQIANELENGEYAWTLFDPKWEMKPVNIKFEIEKNPWEAFQVVF